VAGFYFGKRSRACAPEKQQQQQQQRKKTPPADEVPDARDRHECDAYDDFSLTAHTFLSYLFLSFPFLSFLAHVKVSMFGGASDTPAQIGFFWPDKSGKGTVL
jgi:hypothetical protein